MALFIYKDRSFTDNRLENAKALLTKQGLLFVLVGTITLCN
ncbi:hypothetical protein DealDRAFT_2594 [Dethiobacter alkaliphilus AHT 1]|uniref:Uncharacterized protein n=1 Tax=Dethiobacter alkaliphilus AHT 1 TaxID=555088 RepID=C0GJD5_DETAL|nr:hypothetical protein DealDRAFT_2594 [Dethiobacter alkaliphilus AHT 1]